MIKRAEELDILLQSQMKGGTGTIEVIRLLEPGEYESGLKLIGRLVLHPGCSLGYHVHQGEEEIIHILQGQADYNDDGTHCALRAGDTCLCRSGHGHSIACAGTEELVFYAVINTL